MRNVETRDIQTFKELKEQLESSYQSGKSTATLQVDFNSLRQKSNESAQSFGQRVDNLAMKLYESMVERGNHSSSHKRAILETIQHQALLNFQFGLSSELKILVRSQRYETLQDAIAGATAEETLLGANPTRTNHSRNKNEPPRQDRRTTANCYKCGKTGHYERDCRSSKYALPKPEKASRVTAVEKFCDHCKKRGHNREECWTLNGRTKTQAADKTKRKDAKIAQIESEKDDRKKSRPRKNKSDTERSSDEEDSREESPARAIEYRVSHVQRTQQDTAGLDLITLPIREAPNGTVKMLFDTGATISLIKLKHLKDDTPIYPEKITLMGITGHKARTIGKIHARIDIGNRKIKHTIYVVKDNFPMEYEGILGIDFLRKQGVKCNFKKRELTIGDAVLNLQPYEKIRLPPRSETIVRAATNRNSTGIVRAEETSPGVYIGRCLVEPENYVCPISVINTTDETIEIRTPLVTIDDINIEPTHKVNTIQVKNPKYSPKRNREI